MFKKVVNGSATSEKAAQVVWDTTTCLSFSLEQIGKTLLRNAHLFFALILEINVLSLYRWLTEIRDLFL